MNKRNALIALCICAVGFFLYSSNGHSSGAFGSARILFVGDMMFDRTLRSLADSKGYDAIFSCAADYLKEFDVVVGNLEGPITTYPSLSAGTKPGEQGNTSFTFHPDVAQTLSRHNIGIVSIGNNHILDFGREGLAMTQKYLSESNISYFGSPIGDISIVKKIGDKKIAFVAFNQFLGQNDPQKTIDAIWKMRREADFVVVYAHWGEEYVEVTEYMKSVAHRFIDSGADLILGSHPHVIQEHEIYSDKHIYYSLGNFVFDQYWTSEVRTGLGVELALQGKEILLTEQAFDIQRNGQTCLISSK